MMRFLRYVCVFSICSVLTVTPSVFAKEPVKPAVPMVQMVPSSFANLAENLTPAVVNISTTQKTTVPKDFPQMPQFPEGSPFQDFFDEFMDRRGGGAARPPATSLGSGFIVDADNGYIVTNNHVVKDAEDIRVTFFDDKTVPATLIGSDDKVDLAVLKIETKDLDLTAVPLGDSDVMRVGDWTLAIGNPFGLGGSVTAGIISARARDISSGPYDDYLQTDASINRGNSGGPLFNLNGDVIGINTAIFSPTGGSVGIGFAIPSSLAKPIINQIIKYGRTRRGWIGVRIQNVTDEIAESLGLDRARGALIASVNDDGPADKAGLRAGDVILSINDQSIKVMKTLPRIVAENDIGSMAKVKFWRDEKEQLAEIMIGELEKAEEEGLLGTAKKSTGSGVDFDLLGITMKPMSDALRLEYKIAPTVKGVLISKVEPESEAQKKGLIDGHVIVEINQQPVTDPQEIIDVVKKAQANGRKSVLLLVNEKGSMRFVALKVPQ